MAQLLNDSRNPLWVDVSAFRRKFFSDGMEWVAAPRHYCMQLTSALHEGIELFKRIPTSQVRDSDKADYEALYKEFHYRNDGNNGRQSLPHELLSALHPVKVADKIFSLLDHFMTLGYCIRLECPEAVLSGPAGPKQTPPSESIHVASVLSLPELMASWCDSMSIALATEREAFMPVARKHYPNVPEEIIARWYEVEQGTTLASKIPDWSRVTFQLQETTLEGTKGWDVSGYVPAEYETEVSLRGLSPEQNTWKRLPILMAGRLLHGIGDFRFVRNMPARLKVSPFHKYFAVVTHDSKPEQCQ